jgi:sigma-B regulation protein RsbU (phosphoserine phosphatase)
MQTIKCSEIWGGNEKIDTGIRAGALSISLFSKGTDGDRGGDIYYVGVCGKDMLTRVAIADVSGHGQAVSHTSQWLYDSMGFHTNDLNGNIILKELNNLVNKENREALTTAQIISFNKSDFRLYFSNAGHPPLLIKRAAKNGWEILNFENPSKNANLILGVIENTSYDRESVVLQSNDLILLYTDGVIETRNKAGQLFGVNRLIELLNKISKENVQAVKSLVLDSLLDFAGGNLNHDDVTLVAIEVM